MVHVLYAGLRYLQCPELAYVEAHLSPEQGDVTVPDLDGVTILHLIDVSVPEGEEDDSRLIPYKELAHFMGGPVSSGDYFPYWIRGDYLRGQVDSSRPRVQVPYLYLFGLLVTK